MYGDRQETRRTTSLSSPAAISEAFRRSGGDPSTTEEGKAQQRKLVRGRLSPASPSAVGWWEGRRLQQPRPSSSTSVLLRRFCNVDPPQYPWRGGTTLVTVRGSGDGNPATPPHPQCQLQILDPCRGPNSSRRHQSVGEGLRGGPDGGGYLDTALSLSFFSLLSSLSLS